MFTVLLTVLHPETRDVVMAAGQTITLDEIKRAQSEVGTDNLDTLMEYGVISQTLQRWTETDGTTWEEYWQPVPGGGLVQTRQV